jgi:hypothetical protein
VKDLLIMPLLRSSWRAFLGLFKKRKKLTLEDLHFCRTPIPPPMLPIYSECPKCGKELYYSLDDYMKWACSDPICRYDHVQHSEYNMMEMLMKDMGVRVKPDYKNFVITDMTC